MKLSVYAASKESTIDNQGLASNQRRCIESEENCGSDEFFCLAKAAICVRINNSWPRSVLSSNFAFKSVRNTPGAMAFTVTPFFDYSTAKERVSEATPDLLAA